MFVVREPTAQSVTNWKMENRGSWSQTFGSNNAGMGELGMVNGRGSRVLEGGDGWNAQHQAAAAAV